MINNQATRVRSLLNSLLYSTKMFSTISRRSAPAFAASKRMMSGHANVEEVRAEVSKWYKMTIGKRDLSFKYIYFALFIFIYCHFS